MPQFQSTPVIADGRDLTQVKASSLQASFNPRPSLLTGETFCVCIHAQECNCFNPRPSLLTGETGEAEYLDYVERVSIHARHC